MAHPPARLRRGVLSTLLVAALAVTSGAARPEAINGPLPSSMAAAGDSITRAFDADWFHLVSDAPSYSWATGASSLVDSHYRRLHAANPALGGHAFNHAQTGAKMSWLAAQLRQAASERVGYLSVLMGADDICTAGIDRMTPTETFEAQFATALAGFLRADPTAKVLVASIPNIYQLWSLLHTDPSARGTWAAFGICRSMLAAGNTEADRQRVLARIRADNDALERVCAQWRQCRWDGGATFRFRFTADQISTVDYFHPSRAGQDALADVTWASGWWPGV